MSHTPGPWTAVEQFDENSESLGILIESPIDDIVRIRDLSHETFANARLIAAAPDLLAALRQADAWVAMYHNEPGHDAASRCMTDVIRAAIARATYTLKD
tara:strand:- start:504 stop:803 length:300 start_codon:yes stop_codon:yes gene_type:complete